MGAETLTCSFWKRPSVGLLSLPELLRQPPTPATVPGAFLWMPCLLPPGPPLLDIQEVWEPEELKPPPDWELMLPEWRELGAPCRVEPDTEE